MRRSSRPGSITTVPTIAIAVPSGSHHRAFLQPMRDVLRAQRAWRYLIVSPGAPWADALFPAADYPKDQFSFAPNQQAEAALDAHRPALVVTTTAGLDQSDPPLLEAAKARGIRTATFVESWDNIWKMERIAKGRGKPGQRIVLPDALLVWNDSMKEHALRVFETYRTYKTYRTYTSQRTNRPPTTDRIFVTGSPRLDYFGPRFAAKRLSREETLRYFGLDPARRVLHLATTELYDHGHVAKAISEAKARGDLPADLQLYASVHPGGKMERHKPWADAYGFTIRFSPGRREHAPHPDFRYHPSEQEMLTLVALFTHTDVAVNLSSTVALESCRADRPVVCAFFGKPWEWITWRRSMVVRDFREHYADLLRGGGIAVARNPRQLIQQIREYLAHPEKDRDGRRRSAERIAGTLAGDAADRVLATLNTLTTS